LFETLTLFEWVQFSQQPPSYSIEKVKRWIGNSFLDLK
jgi:hypothetical protein